MRCPEAGSSKAWAPQRPRRCFLQQCCAALDRAIETTRQCETQRRNAVLDHRMAGEVYRRARTATHRKLLAFYSNGLDSSLSELFAD